MFYGEGILYVLKVLGAGEEESEFSELEGETEWPQQLKAGVQLVWQ